MLNRFMYDLHSLVLHMINVYDNFMLCFFFNLHLIYWRQTIKIDRLIREYFQTIIKNKLALTYNQRIPVIKSLNSI
jgi:hypothetical protein